MPCQHDFLIIRLEEPVKIFSIWGLITTISFRIEGLYSITAAAKEHCSGLHRTTVTVSAYGFAIIIIHRNHTFCTIFLDTLSFSPYNNFNGQSEDCYSFIYLMLTDTMKVLAFFQGIPLEKGEFLYGIFICMS